MNKNITILLVIGLLLFIPIHPLISASDQDGNLNDNTLLEYSYFFEKPSLRNVLSDNGRYTKITMNDLSFISQPGKPDLPQKTVKLLLPYGRTIEKISVESLNTKILQDTLLSRIKVGLSTQSFNEYSTKHDESIETFDTSTYYPEENQNIIGVQYKHGYPILFLSIYPVQYCKENNTIRYAHQMEITIETKENTQHTSEFKQNKIDEIKQYVDNPEILDSYPDHDESFMNNGNYPYYDYIIITTENFTNSTGTYPYSFDDLLEYREEQGLSCTYKTVEEIEIEYNGIDLQEKIRRFIQHAASQMNAEWILLGGDVEIVPIRELYDIDGKEPDEKYVPSDMYYACLDGDYNYDGDSKYGEKFDGVNGGIIDLLAEVYVGRAPVDDEQDISAFVEKTLSYERDDWDEDPYLKRVLSAGEELWTGHGGFGAGYVERCIDYCTDYDMETHGIPSEYYDIIELYERDMFWTDDDAKTIINDGVNIINHVGHGTSIAAMKISTFELDGLTNKDKYALFYTQACHSGQLVEKDDCLAEAWVTIPQKGGFAAIMNTGYGYGNTGNYDGADNRLAREFYDALFSPSEKIGRIGKANQDSKEDNIWHIDDPNMFHACYVTTLFGDPYVEIKGAEEASADFSWEPEYPNAGNVMYFIDESKGFISYWEWDFGDGTISHSENPHHIFTSEKTYKVTLTVTDFQGYSSSRTYDVDVKYNWHPIADFTPKDYNGINKTIHFSANNSWDPDGSIVRYRWDFGDGNTSTVKNPIHTYAHDGIYDVCLLVNDDSGDGTRAYGTIVILNQSPPITPDITGQTSAFTGNTIDFSVVSSDPDGDTIQYGWDWDDGSDVEWTEWYSSGETCFITHRWHSIGTHTVRVKARDSYYGESEWSDPIIISISDETTPFVELENPKNGIYIKNERKMPFFTSLVFGSIELNVTATDASGIKKVLFYLDDQHQPIGESLSAPYTFMWDTLSFGKHILTVVAEDAVGKTNSYERTIWKFF